MSRLANFDKVAIGEMEINFLGPAQVLIAKAKLVSSKNGQSYGSTTFNSWSPEILKLLGELKAAMEGEMEKIIFDAEQEYSPTKNSTEQGGIGEYVGQDDTGNSV